MQVVEVAADGLKRQYRVTVPAAEIASRVASRLERLSKTAKVPGFRPGKVPVALLKKQYGRSVMGEVLEQAVDEGSKKAIEDSRHKPALRPKIEITTFDEGKDLEITVDLEVLPEVPQLELSAIALDRMVVEATDEKVEDGLKRLAEARRTYAAPDEPRPARSGDRLVIDFAGTIDGTAFEGGSGTDMPLLLGAGQMVPGFEDQLLGAAAGERRTVTVTFPAELPNEALKGREAVFDVLVKEVQEPQALAIDDAFAKGLGVEDLAGLRKGLKERLESEYKGLARQRTKRQLLDHLAQAVRFEVPPGMVELELEEIWRRLTQEMKEAGQTFASEGEDEEKTRAEYRAIAERRVRLGLLLSDIGTRNDIRVENQELQQAIMREAMRFQGQEKQVFEFYRSNPAALEGLRAPLFEDKVVDFIFQLAKVAERQASVEELVKDDEAPADTASATPAA